MNKLARSITKWTKACDNRLSHLISYIHHTSEFKQHCHVRNTAQQCRLGLFQDYDFARDVEDSESTSGGLLCILGSHTFAPISWMCKKQTSVSHSSTEAELISLDAGLCMDGISALDLWDLVIEVFHSSPNQLNNTKDQVRGNSSRNTQNQTNVPTQHDNLELCNVDYVSSNAKSSHGENFLDRETKIWSEPERSKERPRCERSHLGKDYKENLRSTKNQPKKSLRQFFKVTQKLVTEQTGINGIATIDWRQRMWRETTLLADRAVQFATAKTYVFF